MKNILVPTDFSKNCTKAANLGIKIAKLYDAEIHFLHQMTTPVDWVKLDKQKEKRYPKTVKEIGVAKSKLRELEKKAEHEGLKCRTFLQFDSGQKDILEHSGHFHHDFIVTGSSGTKGVIREITGSNVEKIVRKANAPIIVVKEEDVTFPFKDILFEISKPASINTFLKHQPADLIAMSTHGKTGFLSLFSKSIAEGVTNHSSLPVMTIHIKK